MTCDDLMKTIYEQGRARCEHHRQLQLAPYRRKGPPAGEIDAYKMLRSMTLDVVHTIQFFIEQNRGSRRIRGSVVGDHIRHDDYPASVIDPREIYRQGGRAI
jgi:hypothetical protein